MRDSTDNARTGTGYAAGSQRGLVAGEIALVWAAVGGGKRKIMMSIDR